MLDPELTSAAHAEANCPKRMRTKHAAGSPFCVGCAMKTASHRVDCPHASMADAATEVERAQRHEKWARNRAAHWLEECKKMHGKLALLKAENNQLRKKLRTKKEND